MKGPSPFRFGVIPFVAAVAWLASAARPEPPGPLETRVLVGPDSATKWSAAESTMAASKAHVRAGCASLHWHVTVDHFAGEAKYPIGWPRVSYAFRDAAERNWSGWDYLEMWVYTETSRAALPREPVGLALHAPDKAAAWSRDLGDLIKGQWVRVRIPLTGVPRHDDVRLIQFHISESRYKHGDTLDLYIDGLALLRYARPTILDFAAREGAIFSDARGVTAGFNLAGVKPGEAANVTLEFRRAGKVIAGAAHRAGRGPQALALGLAGKNLEDGDYELSAQVEGSTEPVKTTLRVVASPWKRE